MRTLLLAATSLAALALPASALAGGWATTALSSAPPAGIEAGEAWNVELTIMQHGVTPLEGVEPSIDVERVGVERTFTATPTGKPGVYRARVVFDEPGRWRYEVNDGFSQTHSYPPVRGGGEGRRRADGGRRARGADGRGERRRPALGGDRGGARRRPPRRRGRSGARTSMKPVVLGLVAALATFFVVAAVTGDDDDPAPPAPPPRTAPAVDGRTVFATAGCGSCHRLAAANAVGVVGPDLDESLAGHTAASLRAKILDPGSGSIMPSDFGERLRPAELDALVAFLVEAGRR